MSHTRGTRFKVVGRTSPMSSNRVDMSLLAAKYPVPPEANVPTSHAIPYRWLSGMYCRWMAGTWALMSSDAPRGRRHIRVIRSVVYIAPLGAPVLPEV